MIHIKIDRHALIVTAEGHANYDSSGRDIVCAASSMLMEALGVFARDNGGVVLEQTGYTYVEFPAEENTYLYGGFDALCEGLRMLADAYPQHVQVQG